MRWCTGSRLHRGDAERAQVRDGGVAGQAGVGAAQRLGHAGVALREALDVQLVEHASRPAACSGWRSPCQSKASSTTRALSASAPLSLVSRWPGSSRSAPKCSSRQSKRPTISRAYGSSSSLFGLKRWPCSRPPRAVGAQAVHQARRRRPAGSRAGRRRLRPGSGQRASSCSPVGVEHADARRRCACADNTAKLTPPSSRARPAARRARAAKPGVPAGSAAAYAVHSNKTVASGGSVEHERLGPAVARHGLRR